MRFIESHVYILNRDLDEDQGLLLLGRPIPWVVTLTSRSYFSEGRVMSSINGFIVFSQKPLNVKLSPRNYTR